MFGMARNVGLAVERQSEENKFVQYAFIVDNSVEARFAVMADNYAHAKAAETACAKLQGELQ